MLIGAPLALLLLAWIRSCTRTDHPTGDPVPLSASGLASLFEAECFDLRSFSWAKRNYLIDRDDCRGEITKASIGDCQANVVAEEWKVQTSDPRTELTLNYFFDEVEEPRRELTSCEIEVPKNATTALSQAAATIADRRHLDGPHHSGELGVDHPLVERFWVDRRRNQRVVLWNDGKGGAILVLGR